MLLVCVCVVFVKHILNYLHIEFEVIAALCINMYSLRGCCVVLSAYVCVSVGKNLLHSCFEEKV
jgi:hypothetical protein